MAARGALSALLMLVIVGCGNAAPTVSPGPSPTLASPMPATTALVSPSASQPLPTAVPTSVPSLGPVATPGATPSPTPSPTPTAAASSPEITLPPASTTPEPSAQAGWIGPLQVSERHYSQITMVVDAQGHVHAAALLGKDVWYVTNASGSWIRALIDRPPSGKEDAHPQIAIDPADGSLAVVFSRRTSRLAPGLSEGGYVATNAGGSWSAPALVLDSAELPHVAVRNAAFYFAFDDQNVTKAVDLNDYTRPLFQAGPAAAPIELAPNGVVLAVQAVSGGGAQVMLASWSAGQSLRARIEVAHIDAANQVTTQELPVPKSDGWMARGSFSAGGAPLVTWDNKGGDHFAFENGSWTAPQELNGYAAALDDGGNAYGFNYSLSEVDADSVVASYFRNDGRQFSDLTDLVTTKGEIDPALALDGAGRAYMLISTPAGLSYAVAPAVSGS